MSWHQDLNLAHSMTVLWQKTWCSPSVFYCSQPCSQPANVHLLNPKPLLMEFCQWCSSSSPHRLSQAAVFVRESLLHHGGSRQKRLAVLNDFGCKLQSLPIMTFPSLVQRAPAVWPQDSFHSTHFAMVKRINCALWERNSTMPSHPNDFQRIWRSGNGRRMLVLKHVVRCTYIRHRAAR